MDENRIEIEIDREKFPANSASSLVRTRVVKKVETDSPPKVEKVIIGKVTQKKKSIFDKFSETFFGEDTKSVGSYVLFDVLIPAAKNTILEMLNSGMEMWFYGEHRSRRRDKSKAYVSYSSYYDRDRGIGRDRRPDRERNEIRASRSSLYRFDDYILDSRADAEEVLSTLVEMIDNYDFVRVADFFDAIEITPEFVDNKYGWTNLARATVARVKDGYVLVLPKPELLD